MNSRSARVSACWCCRRSARRPGTSSSNPRNVGSIGFDDEQALLPVTLRGFQGYRLVHEYFAFPQRFLFLDLKGLAPGLRRCDSKEVEIVLLFSRGDATLQSVVDASNVSLFCTPAVNLFSKRVDRIHLTDSVYEYHVVPDRTRPMDFEVYDIESVTGFGTGVDAERRFLPFYADFHTEQVEHNAYYTFQREPRLPSAKQKRTGYRSSYIGSEVFVSLVDPQEAPFDADLKQLSIMRPVHQSRSAAADAGRCRHDRPDAGRHGAGGLDTRDQGTVETLLLAARGQRGVAVHQSPVAQLPVAAPQQRGRGCGGAARNARAVFAERRCVALQADRRACAPCAFVRRCGVSRCPAR